MVLTENVSDCDAYTWVRFQTTARFIGQPSTELAQTTITRWTQNLKIGTQHPPWNEDHEEDNPDEDLVQANRRPEKSTMLLPDHEEEQQVDWFLVFPLIISSEQQIETTQNKEVIFYFLYIIQKYPFQNYIQMFD